MHQLCYNESNTILSIPKNMALSNLPIDFSSSTVNFLTIKTSFIQMASYLGFILNIILASRQITKTGHTNVFLLF